VREASGVKLVQHVRTHDFSVVATLRLDDGESIGEYTGKWRIVTAKGSDRDVNHGYALVLRKTPKAGRSWGVCITPALWKSATMLPSNTVTTCGSNVGAGSTVV